MNRFSAAIIAAALLVSTFGTGSAAALDELVQGAENAASVGAYSLAAAGRAAKAKALSPIYVYGPMHLLSVKTYNGFRCDPGAVDVNLELSVAPVAGYRVKGVLNNYLDLKGTGNSQKFKLKTRTSESGVVHSISVAGRFKGAALDMTYQDSVSSNGVKACVFTRKGRFIKD